MMKVNYLSLWNSKPILEELYLSSRSGKLRYAAKKNLRAFEPTLEDIKEWLKSDALDNDWDGEGAIPLSDPEFVKRFEAFLRDTEVEVDVHLIPEEAVSLADGITGYQEMLIGWMTS